MEIVSASSVGVLLVLTFAAARIVNVHVVHKKQRLLQL